MPLFARGLIHLGDERLGRDSRRKQCSYVSLLALLTEQAIHVFEWNSATIDSILLLRDRTYLDGAANAESLSLSKLLTVVLCTPS